MSSLSPVISIVIPAYNEKMNIIPTIRKMVEPVYREKIPFELIVVNDNCTDETPHLVLAEQKNIPEIRLLNRSLPRGFGRAVRDGLYSAKGEIVMLVMADLSDDPEDIIRYYQKIREGYDCVFGSRFMKRSSVKNYPFLKLIINRIVNRMMQLMFMTKHNDLTNAFKCYKREVIHALRPLHACHFNITIELSLSALIRGYRIASIPITWNGRTWGQSNLKLKEMGRRYLATLLKIWFERMLILDDLMEEKAKQEVQKKGEDLMEDLPLEKRSLP